MSKRQPERSISKDQKATKKVKTNVPDIPSSNFVSREPTKTHRYGSITESEIKSVPKIGLNVKNPSQVISNRSLPKVYQDAMGPDIHQLTKYKKEKMELEKTQKGSNKARFARNEKQELKEARKEEKVPLGTLRNQISKLGDEEDKLVFEKRVNSLKINVNREREKKIKQMLNPPRGNSRNSKFFDPAVSLKSQSRKKRRKSYAFQFIEKGSILRKGEVVSRDSQGNSENDIMNKLQQQIDQSSLVKIEMTKAPISFKRYDPVPNVEWWDAHFLPTTKSYLLQEVAIVQEEKGKQSNDDKNNDIKEASLVERLNNRLELFKENVAFDSSFLQSKINNIIEHPFAFKGDILNQNPVIPVYLTKDEKKKLRRMRRLAKQKEMQEKISLGLVEPPPPKLKYSNFMRIMQYQAIMDPTSAEMQVRKAVQDRLQAHLDRNAKRKLTKKQKAETCMQKLKRDAAVECRVAVFRVDDLSHGAHKFKVNMNAQQLALNGACIVAKSGLNLPSVVVVEGGPKAIRFYKKLMLRRIKWSMKSNKGVMESGEASGEDALNVQEYENKCSLVWEGISKDRSFSKWMTIDIRSEIEGRRLFADRGVEFYWDRVMTGIGDKDDEE